MIPSRQMKGGPELLTFIGAFPKRLQNGAVRAGLVAAAKPVRDQARALAPKQTGKMAKAIRTGSAKVHRDGTVTISISLRGKNGKSNNPHAYIGIFWERGTKAYSGQVIVRGGRRRKRSEKLHAGPGKIFGMFPDIAAHRAHPFMAPALDMRADDAINAFGTRVRSYLKDRTGFTAPVTLEADLS